MKQITVDIVNGDRKVRLIEPDLPQHKSIYIYAAKMCGRVAVVVRDEYDLEETGVGRYRVRALDAMTCGNSYDHYAGDSLVEVIEKLTTEGFKVYQFHTELEFVLWAKNQLTKS